MLAGCTPIGGTPETNPLGIDFQPAMEPASTDGDDAAVRAAGEGLG